MSDKIDLVLQKITDLEKANVALHDSTKEIHKSNVKNNDERHDENLSKFNVIFKKFDTIPCKSHEKDIESLIKSISSLSDEFKWLRNFVFGVGIITLVLGVWISALTTIQGKTHNEKRVSVSRGDS